MNKKTTLIFFALAFTGFLSAQIMFSFVGLEAVPASKQKGQHALYEDVYSKLSLTDVEGKKYQFNKLEQKVVILNFWATWCGPCKDEIPTLVELNKKFSTQDLLILGINGDEDDQLINIKKAIKEYKINFPIIADTKSENLNKFMLTGIPLTIIYKQGKVVEVIQGSKDFSSEEMKEKIESWIKGA